MTDNLPERQPEGRYPTHSDLDLIARFGKMFSMSGMFDDIKGEIQAAVKILAGREVGLQPFAAMQSIDIISGKPVFNSGFLAACVKNHPRYSYRVVELSDDRCHLIFTENGENIGESTFTTEDAQKAGLLGGRSGMYQKYPRNMLFARALSNGVAWHTPDVLSARGYVEGEIPPPDVRPEQEGGATATVPEREPENVIDVTPEPEMGTAVQEPMTGQATATLTPEEEEAFERVDQKTATAQQILTAQAGKLERERQMKADAAKAPEQVAHEAQQASDLADDLHAQREVETAAQEMLASRKAAGKTQAEPPAVPDPGEPAFGSDEPLPPPATDEQKIAAIGALFNPSSPTALPNEARLKVKKACEILDLWDKNTPTALFLLLGDSALTQQGLEEGLAKALDEQRARKATPEPQKPVQTPQGEPTGAAEMLRKQEESILNVEKVLAGLDAAQRETVNAGLTRLGIDVEHAGKELWLAFGRNALDADSLVAAVDAPPWASEDALPKGDDLP